MEFKRATLVEHKKVDIDHEMFKGNDWALPTDIGLVNYAEEAFAGKLNEAGWEDDSFGLLLAFREALINAIAHGNLGVVKKHPSEDLGVMAKQAQTEHPTDKKIYIAFEISKEKVLVKIRDEGNGFKHENIPNPVAGEGIMQTMGRGLFLMENCFDKATFNEKGNEVTMIKEKNESI